MAYDSSISRLVSQFGDAGIAKANRYRVEFQLPSGIRQHAYFTNTKSEAGEISSMHTTLNGSGAVNIMCHSCTLPSRELQSFDIKQFGPPHRMPMTVNYSPISFGFYSDGNLSTRRYFDIWQTAAHNISSNTFNFYNEYVADIRVTVLDASGNDTYFVDIYECWPSSIPQVDYSYSNMDQAQSFAVVMQYKYWQASHDDTRASKTV